MNRIGRYDESRIASSEFFSRFANVYCDRPIVRFGPRVRNERRLVAEPQNVALEKTVADLDRVERVDDLALQQDVVEPAGGNLRKRQAQDRVERARRERATTSGPHDARGGRRRPRIRASCSRTICGTSSTGSCRSAESCSITSPVACFRPARIAAIWPKLLVNDTTRTCGSRGRDREQLRQRSVVGAVVDEDELVGVVAQVGGAAPGGSARRSASPRARCGRPG